MNKPAQGNIISLYPFILVKPLFTPKVSEYGIEVAGAEPDRIPVEVEVVACPTELNDQSDHALADSRFYTHPGEHVFVQKFSSPELKDGTYFVHEDDVMGFREE